MISTGTIATMIISIGICFLLPITLTIFFYKKYKISFKSLFVGAAVFIVFQMVTRIPLIQILETSVQFSKLMPKTLYGLLLAVTAGLFEEVGRYLAFSTILKKKRKFSDGLAFGIGHGGIEAIMIVGLAMISNLVFVFMINSGNFENSMGAILPAEQATQLKEVLIALTPVEALMGGVERVFTLFIQIALTFIVLNGFKTGKKGLYLIYAIIIHTIIDFTVVFLTYKGINVYVIELIVALLAIIGIWYILHSKKYYNQPLEEVENS